uniref:Heparan sulfate 2-O-sulfotransferase 1 n=1 Tax=Sinocyclocheilus anshuiensis TaxID=1608454 RepID=A0A671MJF9_9TELE
MGLLRLKMPPKFQLLALVAFAIAMIVLENQIQKLEESRGKNACIETFCILPMIKLSWTSTLTKKEPLTLSKSLSDLFNFLIIIYLFVFQVRFVKNVTLWKEMKPAFYHGHVSFLDFTKFGVKKKPIYINVIRDPIERLVSYYYFLRFGDDYRPGLRRRKQGDKKTFDECVAAGGSDCAPEKLWLQIPFFCGHYSECWNIGSKWALEQAKYNLVNEYMLVGVTEELEDFVMMLEAALPRFFKGATELYRTGKKSHLRKTSEKKPPTKEAIARLQQSDIWKMENEFYEFALEQFQYVRAHAVREKDGELYLLAQNFFYEKIYPKTT